MEIISNETQLITKFSIIEPILLIKIMKKYKFVFWVNGLFLALITLLLIYAKSSASASVNTLFMPPLAPQHPSERLLTYTFQILCTVPAIVCAFTWGLLNTVQPNNKYKNFIFCSALIMGGFLINEVFRIHVILLNSGIPKLLTIFFFTLIAFLYIGLFRKEIKATIYPLLLVGIGLLIVAVIIDSLGLKNDIFAGLLEGLPKIFSAVNLAIYFWYVCYRELIKRGEFYT